MDGFLNWFFAFMTTMLNGLWMVISGIFNGIVQIFNFPKYIEMIANSSRTFNILDWILCIFAFLFVFAIWGLLLTMTVLLLRKYIRFRKTIVGNDDLLEEIANLHRDVMRLTKEKERIMSLRIGQNSIPVDALNAIYADNRNCDDRGNAEDTSEQPTESSAENNENEQNNNTPESNVPMPGDNARRFFRLAAVDEKYEYYTEPEYQNGFTLKDLCDDFRNFACSKMHLYYEEKTIRLVFAGFASTKLILLQGISGTGKTSLPYAMGKYFMDDSTIASVQPSWRDRSALFGYFNEFTKKFNETEVLRRIYESSYNDNINVIILDEMNIARVEYYFAEMLSVLEMPDPNEWKIELVPSSWPTDPKHLVDGKLQIPQNVWYVGTANNDDSTFSVSDKVYDRAFAINLDSKGVPFDAPVTEPKYISYTYVAEMYQKAIQEHPVSQDVLDKISVLDLYVIQKFRIAFGNRIMKQLKIFVPVYVACGGTEIDGVDYMLATKVFRKFESLNLSLIRDEIDDLISYMRELFGQESMQECIVYLERIKKMY